MCGVRGAVEAVVIVVVVEAVIDEAHRVAARDCVGGCRRRRRRGGVVVGLAVVAVGGEPGGRGLFVQLPELVRAANLSPDTEVEEGEGNDGEDASDEDLVPVSAEHDIVLAHHEPGLGVVVHVGGGGGAVVAVRPRDWTRGELVLEEAAKVDRDGEAHHHGNVKSCYWVQFINGTTLRRKHGLVHVKQLGSTARNPNILGIVSKISFGQKLPRK